MWLVCISLQGRKIGVRVDLYEGYKNKCFAIRNTENIGFGKGEIMVSKFYRFITTMRLW